MPADRSVTKRQAALHRDAQVFQGIRAFGRSTRLRVYVGANPKIAALTGR
jgi:hypothetical protein